MRLTTFATATAIVALVSSAIAATGDIKATFNFEANDFVADPSQPLIYASVLGSSSVVVLNTNTLAVAHTIPLAASSTGIALSPDGNSLYITESTNQTIAVMDTHSFTITRRISLSSQPIDVAAGLDNRLYVLQTGSPNKVLRQIDATTGAPTGSDLGNAIIYSGNLQVSPDRKTLYYAESEMSPQILYAYDVSTTSPTRILEKPPASTASAPSSATAATGPHSLSAATDTQSASSTPPTSPPSAPSTMEPTRARPPSAPMTPTFTSATTAWPISSTS